MDPWWPLPLAAYWGVSFGLLGAQYVEVDRSDPQPGDWLVMLSVGPLVLGWMVVARFLRGPRRP